MSYPRCGWWSYVKHMLRRWPDQVNKDEYAAIQAAIAETGRLKTGGDRMALVDLVLITGSHTLVGAALQLSFSEHTAQRYHADFIRCVGKHFRCRSLE